jgi:AcrR family transcriptional regulator
MPKAASTRTPVSTADAKPARGSPASSAKRPAKAARSGAATGESASKAAAKPAVERPPRPRAKPAGAYHHGDLREALLDAAEALLAQRGAAGLTLRDVARGAGVSHAAPYHHFAGLPELLAALAERSFQQLGAAMQAGVDTHPADAREQLLAIATAYVDFARRRPARFRLMFGPVLASRRVHPGLDRAAEGAFRVLLDAATRFDAAAGPLIALTGWSLAHGLSHLSLDAAFAGLPLPGPLPEPAELVRLMSARVLA